MRVEKFKLRLQYNSFTLLNLSVWWSVKSFTVFNSLNDFLSQYPYIEIEQSENPLVFTIKEKKSGEIIGLLISSKLNLSNLKEIIKISLKDRKLKRTLIDKLPLVFSKQISLN
jgi:hypothetical protein